MNILFPVKCLSRDRVTIYNVLFGDKDGKPIVRCNCSSGHSNTACKHIFSLLLEKDRYIHPDESIDKLASVAKFKYKYGLSDIFMRYRNARNVVDEIEKELMAVIKFKRNHVM